MVVACTQARISYNRLSTVAWSHTLWLALRHGSVTIIMETRHWQAVNQTQVEKAVSSSRFIHKSACGCGFPLYTFRKPGEAIEGRLRPCENHDRADRAQCAHIHYQTVTGDGVLAIRLSKMLWDCVDKESESKPRLWGQLIRITYKGSAPTKYGHAKKIYLVEFDRGTVTPNFQGVENHGATKQRKAREPKAVRRPCRAVQAGAGQESIDY